MMPLLANFGFRVPQESRNGLAKFGRHRRSLSRSASIVGDSISTLEPNLRIAELRKSVGET